jgi:hypothetical protein
MISIKTNAKKSKIKKQVMLFICIILVLLLIAYVFFSLNYQKKMIIYINKQTLQTLANEKAAQVNMFLEFQENRLSVLSSMSVFRNAVLDPNNPENIRLAKEMIDELEVNISGIGILTNEGVVIVSDDEDAGTDYGFMPQFPVKENDSIQFTRYYDLKRKKDYYAIGGPIYDLVEKNKIVGVIMFDIDLNEISSLMRETVESPTNEVYLIDETGLLLSDSEYIDKDNRNGVLIQEIKSEGAEECLNDLKKYLKDGEVEEHEEEIFQYENYMGNEVYGAHAYVRVIGACVIAEKSSEEMFGFSFTGNIVERIKKEVKNEK